MLAGVALLADGDVQRQRAEQRHAVLRRHPFATALPEQVLHVAALGAGMDGHVLDDAQHRHLDFLEHLQRFLGIQRGDVLRRGDDDRPGHRDLLRQRQLDVARPRRQVDQQVIQVAPVDIGKKLIYRAMQHWPAPGHWLAIFQKHSDRNRITGRTLGRPTFRYQGSKRNRN